MPIYSVQGPDGRIYDVEGPEGASESSIISFVQQQLEAGTLKPAGKEGVFAALGKGAESTLSQLRAGVSGIFKPEEAALAGLERGKKIEQEYADQVSAERIVQAFKEKGVLPGLGEAAGQVPYALAEQAPNIAALAGAARAGAMAGRAFGPVGALIGGGLGALGVSGLQQYGGNIQRQAQVQQERGEPVQIDQGAAAAAATGQAALDVAATAIPLGGRLVSKLTGIPVERLMGRTPEQLRKLADERLLATVSKGLATGAAAEIPTEITQQILERAQAGLSLTDEEAMREYGYTAIEVGLLAPLGGMGRVAERGGARQQVAQEEARAKAEAQRAQLEQEELQRQQQAAAEQAEAARRQTPEFALEAQANWEQMQQRVTDLQTRSKAKVAPGDSVALADKQDAIKELQALKKSEEYKTALSDFRSVRPMLQQIEAQRAAVGAQQEQAEQAAQAARMEQERFAGPMMQEDLFGRVAPAEAPQTALQFQTPSGAPITPGPAPAPAAPPAPDMASQFAAQQRELEQLLESQQRQESDAAAKLDLPALEQLAQRRALLQNEYDYVSKQLEALGGVESPDALQEKLDKAKTALQKLAGPGYDPKKADKLRVEIAALTNQIQELGGVPGQLTFGFGEKGPKGIPATREQKIATVEEWNAAIAKKRQEQEAAERQAAEVEAARVAKVTPEVEALKRIKERQQPLSLSLEPIFTRMAEAAKQPMASAAIGQMVADINTLPVVNNARRQYFDLLQFREDNQGRLDEDQTAQMNSRIIKAKNLYETAAKKAFSLRLEQSRPFAGQSTLLSSPQRVKKSSDEELNLALARNKDNPEVAAGILADELVGNTHLLSEVRDIATEYLKKGAPKGQQKLLEMVTDPESGFGLMSLDTPDLDAYAQDLHEFLKEKTAQFNKKLSVPVSAPAPQVQAKTPEALKTRIDAQLGREDLSAESRALLTRMSESVPFVATPGVLNLFDQQLQRIESGVDEITQTGAPRRAVLQRFPIKEVPVSAAPVAPAGKADIQQQQALQKARADAYATAIKEGKTPAEARDIAAAIQPQPMLARYEAKYNEEIAAGKSPEEAARAAFPLSERDRKKAFDTALADGVPPLEAAKQVVAGAKTVEAPEGLQEIKTVGAPVVGKLADVTEPTTLRGPSAGVRVGMSLAPQISTALESVEKARARKEALETERADQARIAQQQAANQAQALQQARETVGKFQQAETALRSKVSSLSKELDDMVARIADYQTAEQLAAAGKSIKRTRAQLVAYNNELLTKGVLDRMRLSGWIDRLEGIKRELEAQTGGNREVRRARKKQIEGLKNDIAQAQKNLIYVETQLKDIEAQLEIAEAHARLNELRRAAPFPYETEETADALAQAQQELEYAVKARQALQRGLSVKEQEERAKRRAAENVVLATEREAKETASIEAAKQRQRELEAQQGAGLGGWRYPMITETQRLLRENPVRIVVTKKDQKQLRKDPDRVLRGIRSRITDLEASIKEKMDRTRGFLIAGHEDVKRYNELRAQYEAAVSAEDRARLLPELERARRNHDETVNRINGAPVLWPGSEKDRRDLLNAYQQEKAFNDFVQSDAFRKEEEGKPQIILSKEQQAKVAEQRRAAEAAEAATRADAPETSGEGLTRSQTAKARAPEKTPYSSKGVSAEERTEGKKQALLVAQEKQRLGKKLTDYEQGLLREQEVKDRDTQYRSMVAPILAKPVEERTELENLVLQQYEDYKASKKAEVDVAKLKESRGEETEVDVEPGAEGIEFVNIDDVKDKLVSQKTTEAPEVPLNKDAIEALKNNDLFGALNAVRLTSKYNLNRVVARRLMTFLRDTQVVVKDDLKNDRGETVYGAASSTGDFIYINSKIGFNEETLLHEAVHAATERIVQMPENQLTAQQLAAKRELQALYEAIKADKDITSENAKESLSEFIAEALSNNLLQRQMAMKKWTFRNAWESFKRVLLIALGIQVPSSMLDAALVATDSLFAQPLVAEQMIPSGPAFKTRINRDGSTTTVLRATAVEASAADTGMYRLAGFQPGDAPFQKATFADAARFGASKARGQRKELFTRLADLFDSAPTPEKQGVVFATNGRRNARGAVGTFLPKRNVVFTPDLATPKYLETLLHELTHAATVYAIERDKTLNGRVTDLRERAVAWTTTAEGKAYVRKHSMFLLSKSTEGTRGIYGLKNNNEFLAELFADREFQKFLTQIPSDVANKNLLTRFVEFMSSFFAAPDKAQQSLFAEAVALSEDILDTTRREIYGSKYPIAQLRREALLQNETALDEINVGGARLVYRKPSYASPGLASAGEVADKFIQKDRNAFETVQAAAGGFLGLETQLVDRFAGFERLSKLMPELKGTQMMYYLRFYDQRMNLVAQSAGNGALRRAEYTRPDGQKEYVIESQPGASLRGVAETLKEAKDIAGSTDAASRLFTLYLSAIRAKDKGFAALHLGNDMTEADLNAAMREIQRTPGLEEIFQRARAEYNEYNRGLINFAVDCGAIPRAKAAELLKENDYIPWYRERNGVAEMVIGNETPIKIGSIAEQPYLHELVGSGKPIMDFMVSSVQNTNMLTDMALRNLATKNAVFELVELKLAKITRRPIAGPNVVRFRVQPEDRDDSGDRYAMIDTDAAGVPADILVKGMEGIPTQMPFVVRALAVPATLLRRAITLSPLYQARQLFRDSLAAPMVAGADFMPVIGALKEVGSVNREVLERRGVTGGQTFTGTQEDLSKIMRDIAGGSNWAQALSKLEAAAAVTDALTRRAQYNSYVAQGLSQMEATLMSLESMNFNKRGASPSIHWLNSMVPFVNAQIQSLNVLYKAMTGKLPFNEKLRIQEKLYTRGLIVAGTTLAYAAAMQDDEAYKNATPDQKYGNWFIRVPGLDEPVRLPIPFEIGYIFKAVPEAIFNTMKNERGAEEAFKAFNQILIQLIPGGTSMPTVEVGQAKIPLGIPIPQAIKVPAELALGKSFYTGRDILTAHEKMLEPAAQFRQNTTELAKMFGERFGVSPIGLEQAVTGYTGTIGLMFMQALSMGITPAQSPEKAVRRWSETPVIGGAFQPNDAGGVINNTYDRMVDLQKVSRTVNDYITRGEKAKANALIAEKANEYAMSEVADYYVTTMREFTQYETAVRASNLTPERKREELDKIKRMKIHFSAMVRQASDKTKPQVALA